MDLGWMFRHSLANMTSQQVTAELLRHGGPRMQDDRVVVGGVRHVGVVGEVQGVSKKMSHSWEPKS